MLSISDYAAGLHENNKNMFQILTVWCIHITFFTHFRTTLLAYKP